MSGWAWFGIIVSIIVSWSIFKAIRSGLANFRNIQTLEKEKEDLLQRAMPVVKEGYEQLTKEIATTWPLVPFDFPRLEDMSMNFRFSYKRKPDIGKIAKEVLAPIITTAVKKYMSYNPDIQPIGQVAKTSAYENFWSSEEKFRNTTNGRNPVDWAMRRKLVHNRDNGICRRCGLSVEINSCHIHHLRRRSEGGNHSFENLVTLCWDCHRLMVGHEKLDGGPFYFNSNTRTVHIRECHHSWRAHRTSKSLPVLISEGYHPCVVCMASANRSLWIERLSRGRLSSIVNSIVDDSEKEAVQSTSGKEGS